MGRIDPVECASEFLRREMSAYEISTTRYAGARSRLYKKITFPLIIEVSKPLFKRKER